MQEARRIMLPDRGWSSLFDRKMGLLLVSISGVFSLVVSGILLIEVFSHNPHPFFDNTTSPGKKALTPRPLPFFDQTMVPLKEEIRRDPTDESLKTMIRETDLQLRQSYFLSRERLNTGAVLLFMGLSVFVFSLRRYAALTESIPLPLNPDDLVERPGLRLRGLLSILLIPLPLAFFSLWGIGVVVSRPVVTEIEVSAATQESAPVPAEVVVPDTQKWPQLRGPSGMGLSEAADLPVSWSAATGENVIWKVTQPAEGHNSPIIWGDKIYLTGGDFESRKVFCLNREDGSLVWTCPIRTTAVLSEDLKDTGDTGLCAPTLVTDGKMIVAFFGTNELVGVDFSGKQVWSRWFGEPDSDFGIAASPMLGKGNVILQLDQGSKDKPHSVLYAIDTTTGKSVWETPREVAASWSTPVVVNSGSREEIITAADPWVISYDPATGKEWWRAKVLSGAVAPLPIFAGGLFFNSTENAQLSAIRAGGSGDITASHVAWTMESNLPDVVSPVSDGKLLLLPNGTGRVRCFNTQTGKQLWSERYDEGFWSSPILVKDIVYLTDMEGNTFIFKLAEEYTLLGMGVFGEKVITSFAIADSRIYVRGEKNLFCLGRKP
jgi:outer membrane protein assembly factor BamB